MPRWTLIVDVGNDVAPSDIDDAFEDLDSLDVKVDEFHFEDMLDRGEGEHYGDPGPGQLTTEQERCRCTPFAVTTGRCPHRDLTTGA